MLDSDPVFIHEEMLFGKKRGLRGVFGDSRPQRIQEFPCFVDAAGSEQTNFPLETPRE